MDLYRAIRELVDEKRRIDRIISSLEAMLAKGTTSTVEKAAVRGGTVSRRGRKSMSAEERREVSERMARYWAAKRASKEGRGFPEDPERPPSTS